MSPTEKEHIVKALSFELSMVETRPVRQRMITELAKINGVMAAQIGAAIGETVPEQPAPAKPSGTSDMAEEAQHLANATSPTSASGGVQQSKALSMADQPTSAKARKVAILVEVGVDGAQVDAIQAALKAAGAEGDLIGPHLGTLSGKNGTSMEILKTYANSSPALYDAVYVPGGQSVALLLQKGDAHVFVAQAYKHAKAIAATGAGVELLTAALPKGAAMTDLGVITDHDTTKQENAIQTFVNAIGARHWGRPALERVPA